MNRITRKGLLIGLNVSLALPLIALFYTMSGSGSSVPSSEEITLSMLLHYLPDDWLDSTSGSVLFIHRGGIDRTSVNHLSSAIQFDRCGSEQIKVVFLLRPDQDVGTLPLVENRHWLQLVRVSEDDQPT